jgi:NAD(P)-dependent dehydrogenase (short-subunit alcohol dehydrogenase family)
VGWLEGQVALVTGGGSGIGRGVVERFIEEGARVAVMDRVTERLEALHTDFGDAVVGIQGDVTSLAENKRSVEETVRAFGKLDVFVGNAGVFDRYQRLDEFPEERLDSAFDELFGVNVKGCFMGAKAALPELQKSQGCMIFTASGAGFNSLGGGSLYTASKHAVVGLVRQLAIELAPQVRVNGVAPGGVMTDLRGLEAVGQAGVSQLGDPAYEERLQSNNPLGLAMQPSDLAGAYVYLASRANARGITGTFISVDAGSGLRWIRRLPGQQS